MILILIERSYAFTVHDETLVSLLSLWIGELNRLVPDPESLGARIDGGPHTEALFLVLLEQNTIEKKGLACSVLSRHCNDSHHVILQAHEELLGLLPQLEALLFVIDYKVECLAIFSHGFGHVGKPRTKCTSRVIHNHILWVKIYHYFFTLPISN